MVLGLLKVGLVCMLFLKVCFVISDCVGSLMMGLVRGMFGLVIVDCFCCHLPLGRLRGV